MNDVLKSKKYKEMNDFFKKEVALILAWKAKTSEDLVEYYKERLRELLDNPNITFHYEYTNMGGYYTTDTRSNWMIKELFCYCNNSDSEYVIRNKAKKLGLGVAYREAQ